MNDIILVAIIAQTGTILGISLKFVLDKRAKEKQDASRDDAQDKMFAEFKKNQDNILAAQSRIENDVKELNIFHKYEKAKAELSGKVKSIIGSVLLAKNCKNDEISQILMTSAKQLKSIVATILENDFQDCQIENTKQLFAIETKPIETTINFMSLEVVDVKKFMLELRKMVQNEFDNFSIQLNNIADNCGDGIRIEKFKILVLELVQKISIQTCEIHNVNKK